MSIRIRCKCGKSLKISSKFADKRIACPACRHPFRISAAKFAAASRNTSSSSAAAATPSQAPHSLTRAASAALPTESAPLPASLDDDLAAVGTGDNDPSDKKILLEFIDESMTAPTVLAPAAVPVSDAVVDVAYARDAAPHASPRRISDPVAGPVRGFWADAAISVIYPCKSAGNLINLAIAFVIASFEYLATLLPFCLVWFIILVVKGWFASLYFAIIRDTAAGSEDLPGVNMEDGLANGVLRPAFRFIGAGAIVFLPFMGLSLLAATGVTPAAMNRLLYVWFFAGVFLAPMSFLLFALNSGATILRIDLVLMTIARTILPYLAIWLLLAVIFVVMLIASVGGEIVLALLFPDGLMTTSGDDLVANVVVGILLTFISVYLMLVAMRVIGLYYLHFKKRFAFIME